MDEKLSLTELQHIIRDSLYIALPDVYWVIAEISEIKENYSGHCYVELIEKHPDEKNVRARIKGIIWNNRYRFLKALFENIAGETLQIGHKILIKTKIEYHELYGMSLIITDIDPAFTIGDMALRRQLVIKQLEDEGVSTMNKELEFPTLPRRIAIISSKNAAGYADFMHQLNANSFGYSFNTALFETPMQGSDTEKGVINALDKIASHADIFDVTVIIRGGGSQTDLSWFDNYNIAYYITQFPLPVITGIGHEKDYSVADLVANRSLKTPTAVADMLIEEMADAERIILDLSQQIRSFTEEILQNCGTQIESTAQKLLPLARQKLSDTEKKLSGIILEMVNFGKGSVARASRIPSNQESRLRSSLRSFYNNRDSEIKIQTGNLSNYTQNYLVRNMKKISDMENTMNILNPLNILKRGFTITSLNGTILRSKTQLKKNNKIVTKFGDGTISSKVVDHNS